MPSARRIALADSSGTAQTSYTYDPFGTASSTGSQQQQYPAVHRPENDGTGLQYNRARYYSPTLQRFISEDPAGFGGGDVNLYAYAGNDPINATDPSGQFIIAFIAEPACWVASPVATTVGRTRDAKIGGAIRPATHSWAASVVLPLRRTLSVPRLR